MADSIRLRGIRAVGTHGVEPEEQARAQPFEVDLDVECDLRRAGRTDDLSTTIDYGALAQVVHDVVSGERHFLIERVAERIADLVLAEGRATTVTVEVRKLRPPVPVDLETAGVRITRP